jgi:hypothetical protein
MDSECNKRHGVEFNLEPHKVGNFHELSAIRYVRASIIITKKELRSDRVGYLF